MASERQIAANRRNAKKSTGPRSIAGKKRVRKNAYRHGLSVPMSTYGNEAKLKELARQFAGNTTDAEILGPAERAAEAQLDLARVRTIKSALIERALMEGASPARFFNRDADQNDRPLSMREERLEPEVFDSMPPAGGTDEEEPQFLNDGVHILAELTCIDRYEKRSAGRRDRAICKIISVKAARNKSTLQQTLAVD